MIFYERLKSLREEKGLTQMRLFEITGITTRQIQKYEGGKVRLRLDAAEKPTKALDVSTDGLLGNADMLAAQTAEKYGARGGRTSSATYG